MGVALYKQKPGNHRGKVLRVAAGVAGAAVWLPSLRLSPRCRTRSRPWRHCCSWLLQLDLRHSNTPV